MVNFSIALELLRSTAGRGLAGLTALAMLAWFLWPEDPWTIHPDALSAFVVAFVAWVASLGPSDIPPSTQHDRDLLKKFRALLSDGERSFLRDHNFGDTFDLERLKGIRELVDVWRGAEYEFDDEDVQAQFSNTLSFISEFSHRLAEGAWVIDATNKWMSVIPDTERHRDVSKATWAKIKDLNERATKLSDDIDHFIKFSRRRIDK